MTWLKRLFHRHKWTYWTLGYRTCYCGKQETWSNYLGEWGPPV